MIFYVLLWSSYNILEHYVFVKYILIDFNFHWKKEFLLVFYKTIIFLVTLLLYFQRPIFKMVNIRQCLQSYIITFTEVNWTPTVSGLIYDIFSFITG